MFVLQPGQLTRFSRDGASAKVAPLKSPLAAFAFSEKRGVLYGFNRATSELLQFDTDLKLLRTDKLPITLPTSGRIELVSNPVNDEVSLLCDGSVQVLSWGWERGVTNLRKITLQGARTPVGLEIDGAGNFVVSDQGKVISFDPSGRPSKGSPFIGLAGGANQHLVRPFSNFNSAIHTTPSFHNVLPPTK